MSKRRVNPNLAKVNRSYSFEELAGALGVHKNTVGAWVKNGLPCLKDQRPYLILGGDVRIYLQKRRSTRKQKCKIDEMFCMSCKKPSKPAENYVEYVATSLIKGRLEGLCERCECLINKFVSFDSLAVYSEVFDLSLPKELEHIKDSDNPLLNSDFTK